MEWEWWVRKFMDEHAKGVCVDAGAGIGAHTFYMADLPDVDEVHAFEPIPYNVYKLKEKAHPKVRVYAVALSDRYGLLRLYAPNINKPTEFPWINARFKPYPGNEHEYIWVIMGPLYEFLDHVDFMKIDVEGMEVHVLRGAEGVIDDAYIVVETHRFLGVSNKQVIQAVQETHKPIKVFKPAEDVWYVFLGPK